MSVFVLSTLLPFTMFLHAGADMPQSGHAVLPAAHISAYWAIVLSCIWAFASLASLSRLLLSGFRLRRILRSAQVVDPASLTAEMQAVLRGTRPGAEPISLALSRSVDSPMVIGFFHRTIVLPEWLWARLSSVELNQVVLHETAHLTRGDDWTNLLQKTLRALFPLNPALFFAERRLCREREMACDDAVLGHSVSPREYALCLTNLAEKGLLNRLQTLAPGAWRRRSELAERVHRILRSNSSLKPLGSRPAAAAFLTMLLCAGAALTRCPRIVTFTVAEPAASLTGGNHPAAHMERASLSMSTGIHSQPSAHLVEATLRMPAPSRAFHTSPAHRSLQRRHTAARRRVPARPVEAQFVQAAFVQSIHQSIHQGIHPSGDPQAVSALSSPQLYVAIFGIALPADGISIHLPSQAGWIIVQL
jgi:beta-lactamase regulating signal transducer with metallopeptidase domain